MTDLDEQAIEAAANRLRKITEGGAEVAAVLERGDWADYLANEAIAVYRAARGSSTPCPVCGAALEGREGSRCSSSACPTNARTTMAVGGSPTPEQPVGPYSTADVEAIIEAVHTSAREPDDDSGLPLTIEAATKWASELLGRPVPEQVSTPEQPVGEHTASSDGLTDLQAWLIEVTKVAGTIRMAKRIVEDAIEHYVAEQVSAPASDDGGLQTRRVVEFVRVDECDPDDKIIDHHRIHQLSLTRERAGTERVFRVVSDPAEPRSILRMQAHTSGVCPVVCSQAVPGSAPAEPTSWRTVLENIAHAQEFPGDEKAALEGCRNEARAALAESPVPESDRCLACRRDTVARRDAKRSARRRAAAEATGDDAT
jgi:hypothetical protein